MTIQSISGFKIKQRKGIKTYWHLILEEWILIHERYCRQMEDSMDAIYFYTERANVGAVAAAGWRAGVICLQEGHFEKGFINKPKWKGFHDLYISHGLEEEMIEAKFKWLSLDSKDPISICNDVLENAVYDAKNTCGSNKNIDGLGIAFIPVYRPKSKIKSQNDIDSEILNLINDISSNSNAHICAWVFPKETRVIDNDKNVKNYTPGLIMLAANPNFA